MAVISRSCIAVLANFFIACAWPGDGADTGEAPEWCVLGAPGLKPLRTLRSLGSGSAGCTWHRVVSVVARGRLITVIPPGHTSDHGTLSALGPPSAAPSCCGDCCWPSSRAVICTGIR